MCSGCPLLNVRIYFSSLFHSLLFSKDGAEIRSFLSHSFDISYIHVLDNWKGLYLTFRLVALAGGTCFRHCFPTPWETRGLPLFSATRAQPLTATGVTGASPSDERAQLASPGLCPWPTASSLSLAADFHPTLSSEPLSLLFL